MFDKFKKSMRQPPHLEINLGKHTARFTGIPAIMAGGAIGVGVGKTVNAARRAIRSRHR